MIKLDFKYVLFFLILLIVILLVFNLKSSKVNLSLGEIKLDNRVAYKYEICDDRGICKDIPIDKVIQPSEQTFYICNPEGNCEDVPINRILLKEGTDKKYCSKAPYLKSDYVDNWWNANGIIDECEMPPKSDMQFAFKLHNQTLQRYTGTIQIFLTVLNYENNYLALQVLTGEDNDENFLPDQWIHCGNVDEIKKGKQVKIINCNGTNIRFVKLVNAEWNPTSLYLDRIEVLKYE